MTFVTNDPLEKSVIKELQDWVLVGLSKPNEFFNGLPPCPYAQKAWAEEKVAVIFRYETSWQPLYSVISQYDDTFDIAVVVSFGVPEQPEDFHENLAGLNQAISDGMFIDQDIWLMGYHPEDEEADFVNDTMVVEAFAEQPYSMVFVQRLTKIQEAAYKLVDKGYYSNYLDDLSFCGQYAKREQFYQRLRSKENGRNEKETPGEEGRRRSDAEAEARCDASGWFTETYEKRWKLGNERKSA